MNRLLKVALLVFTAVIFSPSAFGMAPGTLDYREKTRMNLGVDFVSALPTGNLSDEVGLGLGGLARFEYGLNESWAATGRAGFIAHMTRDAGPVSVNYDQVPLLAGLKYSLRGTPVYLGAEAGAVVATTSTDRTGGPAAGRDTETRAHFAWTGGAGYELGPIDIRLFLYFPDVTAMDDATEIGMSFGYNFWGR